jgi:hypothetical protein
MPSEALQYRTVRVRPFRKNNMEEAGYTMEQGATGSDLCEVWIGGELEAVLWPDMGKDMIRFRSGRKISDEVLVEFIKGYIKVLNDWGVKS